jgi:hypothetical protein
MPIFSALELGADGEKQLFDSIRRLSDQLLKARVSIYSVDPRGVGRGEFLTSSRASNNLAFGAYLNALSQANNAAFGDFAIQTLATQTGGHAFYGRNDVDREIATSLTDGNTYYTVSYAPSDRDFHGEFRKVKISVIGRPDLKVQTRDGYYAMPDNQTNPKRELQELVGSLLTSIPFNGIPIPISYTRLVKSPAPHLTVRFLVPSTSLSWTPDAKGRLSAQITIAAADNGKHGKHGAWKASMLRAYTVSMPDDATPSVASQTSVNFEMPYRDSNHLRFIVRDDATGRIGSSEIKVSSPVAGAS